jgi:hypothetical protein
MSTWHKQVTKSLADSVSAVLNDMREGEKGKKGKNPFVKKGDDADDEEEEGQLDPVDKKAVMKKFDDRKDQDLDNDGDTDSSDKFLHKKRKAITKAIRNTSESGKKVKLSGKKEPVVIGAVKENVIVENTFSDDRSRLREALEASFDTIFQYSNKEEEAYRDQWMGQFDSIVAAKDPNAYLDPLQRRVFYVEGMTPEQAAGRYLAHCSINASLSGGEYQKYGTTGGDPNMSSKNQGQPVGNVYQPGHQVNHK